VRGYLLDTNHVGAYHRKEPNFVQRLRDVPPQNLPRVCAITLGEIEAGMRLTTAGDQVQRDDYARFVLEDLFRLSWKWRER